MPTSLLDCITGRVESIAAVITEPESQKYRGMHEI